MSEHANAFSLEKLEKYIRYLDRRLRYQEGVRDEPAWAVSGRLASCPTCFESTISPCPECGKPCTCRRLSHHPAPGE
jgi:hypothetical protein